jgi:prepilin-type N-terminal cleavage/methylation domain-containing protein
MKIRFKKLEGFSLVELLIVLAILSIIVAVTINIFINVLEHQKQKTDISQAAFLQSAIQAYVTDSDDIYLADIGGNTTVIDIVNGLKNTVINNVTNTKYGPYLKSDYPYGTRSQKYKGMNVTIYTTAQSVEVNATTAVDSITYK